MLFYSPGFPSTCPYITTVGATYLPSGADIAADAEVAVSRFGSGGGFSNLYPIPSYQSDAVNGYLTHSPPPYPSYYSNDGQNIGANGGIFNNAGRGYPDVSAIGDNIIIYNNLFPTTSTDIFFCPFSYQSLLLITNISTSSWWHLCIGPCLRCDSQSHQRGAPGGWQVNCWVC
jgi:hypothetical protein